LLLQGPSLYPPFLNFPLQGDFRLRPLRVGQPFPFFLLHPFKSISPSDIFLKIWPSSLSREWIDYPLFFFLHSHPPHPPQPAIHRIPKTPVGAASPGRKFLGTRLLSCFQFSKGAASSGCQYLTFFFPPASFPFFPSDRKNLCFFPETGFFPGFRQPGLFSRKLQYFHKHPKPFCFKRDPFPQRHALPKEVSVFSPVWTTPPREKFPLMWCSTSLVPLFQIGRCDLPSLFSLFFRSFRFLHAPPVAYIFLRI